MRQRFTWKGEVNLLEAVRQYPEMLRGIYSLELAVQQVAIGTLAHHMIIAGCYLLAEAIADMPDEVVAAWNAYDDKTLVELETEIIAHNFS